MGVPLATYDWSTVERKVSAAVASVFDLPRGSIMMSTSLTSGHDNVSELAHDLEEVRDIVAEELSLDEHSFGWTENLLDEHAGPWDIVRPDITVGDIIWSFSSELPFLGKRIEQQAVTLSLASDGEVRATARVTEGSWTYVNDDTGALPCGICVTSSADLAAPLAALEALIRDESTTERELQDFLVEYPELLRGDDYDRVIAQACIVTEQGNWYADFVLVPIDQRAFCQVLELKRPSTRLLRKRITGHSVFTQHLWSAITQLRDYGEAFDDARVRERFKEVYGVEVFKPELVLVAGRQWDLNLNQRIQDMQRREQVLLVDWDSYLAKLRRRAR